MSSDWAAEGLQRPAAPGRPGPGPPGPGAAAGAAGTALRGVEGGELALAVEGAARAGQRLLQRLQERQAGLGRRQQVADELLTSENRMKVLK